MHDRLKENRACIHAAFLIGNAGSRLESHFRRIHRMIGSVIQFRMQMHHRITSEHTMHDILSQTFFYGRNEVAGNRTANNGIFKLEINILVIDRRELDPNITKLAMSAGLLLMTSLNLDCLADRLTIRNLGIPQICFCTKLALQLIADNIKMHFAQAGKNGLRCFRILFQGQ